MTNIIDSLSLNGTIGVISLPYVECASAIDDTAKVVTTSNFALEDGTQLAVRFSKGNSATENVTLNVNNLGAKTINNPIKLFVGSVIYLVYNKSSTSWKIVSNPINYEFITTADIDEICTFTSSVRVYSETWGSDLTYPDFNAEYEIGTTWAEWIASSYNAYGLTVSGTQILDDTGMYYLVRSLGTGSQMTVTPTETIGVDGTAEYDWDIA